MIFLIDDSRNTVVKLQPADVEGFPAYKCFASTLSQVKDEPTLSANDPEVEKATLINSGYREISGGYYFEKVEEILETRLRFNRYAAQEYQRTQVAPRPAPLSAIEIMEAA